MTAFATLLSETCLAEWELWDRGQGKETQGTDQGFSKDFFLIVKKYWVSIGNNNLTGRTEVNGTRPAWSSAFVSFCVREAGAGSKFKYSEAHCHYTNQAMEAFDIESGTYGYWARRPDTYAPKVGDIVVAGREYAKRYDYDQARLIYEADSFYPSHGDMVVALEPQNNRVVTIGGNVENNVQRKFFATTPEGRLLNRVVGGEEIPWIAVLECRL